MIPIVAAWRIGHNLSAGYHWFDASSFKNLDAFLFDSESDWTPLFVVFLVGLTASAAMLTPLWRTKPPTA